MIDQDQFLSQLIHNIPGTIFQFLFKKDGSFEFPYITGGRKDYFGLTPEDVLSDPSRLFSVLSEEDNQRVQEAIQRSAQEMSEFQTELKVKQPSGEVVWLRIRSTPQKLENGDILWSGVALDITDRKVAEQALREEKNLAQKYLDVIRNVIVILNPKGEITLINQVGCQVLGYAEEEIVGKNWFETCLPADEKDEVKSIFTRTMAGDMDPISDHENRIVTKDGQERVIAWRNAALRDEDGNITNILSSGEDITEHRQAEQRLARTTKTSNDIVKAIPSGLFIYQFEPPDKLTLLEGNPAAEHLTDIRISDWIGREFNEIWPNAQSIGLGDSFLEVMRTGETYSIEDLNYEDERLQGAFKIRAFRLPGDKLAVSFENITDRKRAEEELREKQEFLQAIFDNSLNAIIIADDAGNYREANSSAAGLLGYPHDELIGMNVRDLKTTRLPTSDKLYQEYVARGQEAGEFEFIRPDGDIRVAQYLAIQIEKDFNLSIMSDITMRKQNERALQESEELFRTVFEQAATGVAQVHPDGRFLRVNSKFCEIVGYSQGEILGKDYQNFTHPDDLNQGIEMFKQALNGEIDSYEIEKRCLHKAGHEVWIKSFSKVVRDEAGSAKFIIFVIADMTDQVLALQAVKENESKLKNAERIAHFGHYEIHIESSNTKWSDGTFRIFGLDPEADSPPTAESYSQYVHPEDVEALYAHYKNAIDQGQSFNLEYRIVSKDGRLKHVRSYGTLMNDSSDGGAVMFGTLQDITQEVEADHDLHTSRERLQLALKAANQGIYDLNVQTGEAQVSDEYVLMLGYEPESFQETNAAWIERLHPDDREVVSQNFRDYISGKIPEYRVEFRQRTKSGQWKWILSIGKIVERDSDGEPLRMLGTHTDITKEKQAEIDLKESNEGLKRTKALLEKTFSSLTEAVFVIDPKERTVVTCNPAVERVFGYKQAEIVGRNTEFLHIDQEAYERFGKIGEPILNETGVFQIEYQMRHKNGEILVTENTVSTILDEKGWIDGVVSVVRDITERKQMELKLAESERKYRTLVETANDLIWAIDANGIITFMNRASERIYGYKPEELIGKHWTIISEELEIEDADRILHQTALEGGTVDNYISKMRHRDGHEVILRANAVQLYDSEGEYIGSMGTSQDITEFIELQNKIEHSREQLRALNNYLQSAIEEERAHISRELHDEFGQLLTGIKMDLSKLARHTEKNSEQHQSIQEINKMLDLAIESTRRISSQLRPGLLDDLGLFAALEWYSEEFNKRGKLVCSLSLPAEEPDLDPDLQTAIFRIYQESLTNVARHARATKVNAKLSVEDNSLLVKVKDNGRGIAKEKLKQSNSLGLLGMQERAAQWRGTVEVIGAKGRGTVVTLSIPLPSAKLSNGFELHN